MTDAFDRAAERTETEERRRHRERAAKGRRAGLRIHAAVFVAVQLLLVVVWLLGDRSEPWFLYVLVGWGVGLAAHAAAVRGPQTR